jgi:hypothetical protein
MIRGTLAALVSATLVLAALAAPSACIVPSISQNTDAGTAAASSSDAGATATATAAQGASCTQINATTSLCQFINLCPTLTLNTSVFPQCGFRIHGDAIDPECFCDNEYLCPIGSPTTCAEAATESTGDVTYDSVCQQYLTGHCTDLNAAASAGSTSTGSTSTGSTSTGSTTTAACQSCLTNCANVPACIEACGC